MNIKKLFAGMAALALAMTFGVSCSMPGMDDLADNGRDAEVRLGFTGGSLAVGDGLVPGSRALVRLGAVEAVETGYVDKAAEARFGLLTVNSVDAQAISFDFARFGANGDYEATVSHTLSLGEEADLNGDGVPDVVFDMHESIAQLFFVSTLSELRTTTFATLAREQGDLFITGLAVVDVEQSMEVGFHAYEIAQAHEDGIEARLSTKAKVIIIACCLMIIVAVCAY
ncbi:MAG: hypothetical protein FWE09_07420 [Treponema sp.]|nr:hypothetical protein [Treponema sp.]